MNGSARDDMSRTPEDGLISLRLWPECHRPGPQNTRGEPAKGAKGQPGKQLVPVPVICDESSLPSSRPTGAGGKRKPDIGNNVHPRLRRPSSPYVMDTAVCYYLAYRGFIEASLFFPLTSLQLAS